MKINASLHDEAILVELGARLRAWRLRTDLSQAEAAAKAGLNRKVVARIEAGEQVHSGSLIRLLRALGLLESLNELIPEPSPTPLEVFSRQSQKERQRVSPRRAKESAKTAKGWEWADDH